MIEKIFRETIQEQSFLCSSIYSTSYITFLITIHYFYECIEFKSNSIKTAFLPENFLSVTNYIFLRKKVNVPFLIRI